MKDTYNSVGGSADQLAGLNQGLFDIQNLLNFSPDVICALDKEGRFLYVSVAAKEDLGYDPTELSGMNLLHFIVESDRPQSRQMLETARSRHISTRF
jgi:PAS domain S-box-containing protein